MLVKKLHPHQILDIISKLGHLLVDINRAENRDITAIGLKTIVTSLPNDPAADSAVGNLATLLLHGLKGAMSVSTGVGQNAKNTANSQSSSRQELVLASLDVLKELLLRFGSR
jgi:hypothetical protein